MIVINILQLLLSNIGKLKLIMGNKYKKVTMANLIVSMVSLLLFKYMNISQEQSMELFSIILGLNLDTSYFYIIIGVILAIFLISSGCFLYFLFKKELVNKEAKCLALELEKEKLTSSILSEKVKQKEYKKTLKKENKSESNTEC